MSVAEYRLSDSWHDPGRGHPAPLAPAVPILTLFPLLSLRLVRFELFKDRSLK